MKDYSLLPDQKSFCNNIGQKQTCAPQHNLGGLGICHSTAQTCYRLARCCMSRPLENSHFLVAIVESADDAIISKDLNGIITSWNKGAERLFGYTAEETLGKPVTMIVPPDRLDEEVGILERIKRGKRTEHFETVRQRKDGSLVEVSLTTSPIRTPGGRRRRSIENRSRH